MLLFLRLNLQQYMYMRTADQLFEKNTFFKNMLTILSRPESGLGF